MRARWRDMTMLEATMYHKIIPDSASASGRAGTGLVS